MYLRRLLWPFLKPAFFMGTSLLSMIATGVLYMVQSDGYNFWNPSSANVNLWSNATCSDGNGTDFTGDFFYGQNDTKTLALITRVLNELVYLFLMAAFVWTLSLLTGYLGGVLHRCLFSMSNIVRCFFVPIGIFTAGAIGCLVLFLSYALTTCLRPESSLSSTWSDGVKVIPIFLLCFGLIQNAVSMYSLQVRGERFDFYMSI